MVVHISLPIHSYAAPLSRYQRKACHSPFGGFAPLAGGQLEVVVCVKCVTVLVTGT